jgi:hypothetical protein
MKIPSPAYPARLLNGAMQSGSGQKGENDAFLKFLETATAGHTDKSNNYGNIPLNKESLKSLVQMMEIQMNNHLIRSVLMNDHNSEESDTGFPFQRSLGLPFGMFNNPDAMSKNQHLMKDRPQQNAMADKTNMLPTNIEAVIGRASDAYGVDSGLIRAVIKTESGFKSNALSSKGAQGLMQLMPGTARELGVRNPFDPEENIMAGTRYLKGLLDRYDGDRNLALAAYNWGMGNVERNPGKLPKETLNYIVKVNKYYQG